MAALQGPPVLAFGLGYTGPSRGTHDLHRGECASMMEEHGMSSLCMSHSVDAVQLCGYSGQRSAQYQGGGGPGHHLKGKHAVREHGSLGTVEGSTRGEQACTHVASTSLSPAPGPPSYLGYVTPYGTPWS